MNTIDLSAFGSGGGKTDKLGADGAAEPRDSGTGTTKDVFRNLLRHLSGGKVRGDETSGAQAGGAAAAKSERPAPSRPGLTQPVGGTVGGTVRDMPTAASDATPAPMATPNGGDAAATPMETTGTPLATILTWPDVISRPAAEPEAANDDDDRPRDEAVGLDAILQAVSSALTETPAPAALPARAPAIGAEPSGVGTAVAANAAATGAKAGADPVAALHAALRSDGPDLDIAPAERGGELPKLTVLTRETHFEPVQRLSPVQQIVTTIVDDLAAAETVESAPTPATPETEATQTVSRGPLRVLHIKLEPEDLGAVVLRMRLVGQSLELHLEASRAETARLLDKDRDALTRVLRASGYAPDVVTVQTAVTPDSASSQAGRSGGQDGASSAGGFQQQPSRDGRPGEGRSSAPPSSPHQELAHDDADAGRVGGDVYV